jgi:hypothetical protein
MTGLPFYIPLTFALAIILTIFFFYRATRLAPRLSNPQGIPNSTRHSSAFLLIALTLILIQSLVTQTGFYATPGQPLRFLLLLPPPLAAAIGFSRTNKGRSFFATIDLATLTLLHLIRIPVELVLFWLSLHHAVPKNMTFEGMNFDILMGFTAPFIYYFGFVRKTLLTRWIIAWNWMGIALLSIVVSIAVRTSITPSQPHSPLALLLFPWTLLPGFMVPTVFFTHYITLRGLKAKK